MIRARIEQIQQRRKLQGPEIYKNGLENNSICIVMYFCCFLYFIYDNLIFKHRLTYGKANIATCIIRYISVTICQLLIIVFKVAVCVTNGVCVSVITSSS